MLTNFGHFVRKRGCMKKKNYLEHSFRLKSAWLFRYKVDIQQRHFPGCSPAGTGWRLLEKIADSA